VFDFYDMHTQKIILVRIIGSINEINVQINLIDFENHTKERLIRIHRGIRFTPPLLCASATYKEQEIIDGEKREIRLCGLKMGTSIFFYFVGSIVNKELELIAFRFNCFLPVHFIF